METKPRYEFIDLAKGICIILVVFMHVVGKPFPEPINLMLKSFRMPLYFILSGMFFSLYDGFLHFVIKKTNKLLIPFLTFAILGYVLLNTKSLLLGYNPRWNVFSPLFRYNFPLWFLPCLFECGTVFYLLVKISQLCKRGSIYVLCSISILLGFLGFMFGRWNIQLPILLGQSLLGLPFFAFGYVLRKHTDFLSSNYNNGICILTAAVLMLLTLCTAKYSAVDIATCGVNDRYFVPYLWGGVIGTMSILLVSKVVVKLPFVSYIGRYSICVLVTHYLFNELFFVSLCNLLNDYMPSVPMVVWKLCSFVLIILSYIVIIPFMLKYMPHVCAQKDVIKYNG